MYTHLSFRLLQGDARQQQHMKRAESCRMPPAPSLSKLASCSQPGSAFIAATLTGLVVASGCMSVPTPDSSCHP